MRTLPALALLFGCPGPNGDSDPGVTGDQLRALGVNVGGFNVIHGAPPTRDAGTDFGPTPLQVDDYLTGGLVDVRIVGTVTDWQAELVGDPAFTFVLDPFFGDLAGVQCVPPGVGTYQADMIVTAPSQPTREFRVRFACQGDDRARIVPFSADDIGADGTLAGGTTDGTGVKILSPGGATITLDAAGTVSRTGVLDDGGVILAGSDGLRVATPNSPVTTVLPLTSTVAGAPWVASDGTVALYSDGNGLHRVEVGAGTDEAIGPSALYTELVWADPDARFALTNSGAAASTIRDLLLIDTTTGDMTPFLDPDGEPWGSGYGTGVAALSPDRTRFLRYFSYYYEVGLAWVDVATAEQTELLDRAQADMEARFETSNHGLSDIDVTPDGRFAAVVFDDIAADPGGFQLRGSAVYVIDLADGTTWLASVDAKGETLRFALGSFDGQLVEHVRIRPDGDEVLFAHRYVTERSLWVEVP